MTLAFLGLPLFLKSAGGPLQNNSKSETELRGRKIQTWGTAGNLTDMLSRSITQKLEIKLKISFKKKKKFCKSPVKFACPVEANKAQDIRTEHAPLLLLTLLQAKL